MPVTRLALPAEIMSEVLPDIGPVKEPVGDLVANVRMQNIPLVTKSKITMGVWECSPGSWRRQVMEEEFAHFIAGKARFTPDGGSPIEINTGDALWFPANSTGTWEIFETIRKVYIVVGERSRKEIAVELLKGLLRAPSKQVAADGSARETTGRRRRRPPSIATARAALSE